MVLLPSRSLLGLACLSLSTFVGASLEPITSPAADTELICPTSYAGDCYPRIFQPTEDFETIKEGQDIPPGLHVRMNIYTGEKEARLNIPMEGAEGSEYDVASEQAMVVIEQPESEEYVQDEVTQDLPLPKSEINIPPPPPTDGNEIGSFHEARSVLNAEGLAFDTALNELSELAHDVYYGVEITRDRPTLQRLLCLVLGSGSQRFPAHENKRDHKAASILASALQNNPSALEEIANNGHIVTYPTCGTELVGNKLEERGVLVDILRGIPGHDKEPSSLKAKVTLVGRLAKEPRIRGVLLRTGVMEELLAIWLEKGEQWDGAREKVAQLVMDNFLDESMGAELGIWPKQRVSESGVCETTDGMFGDGCWEHHVEKFLETSPKSSWAKEFLNALREQRSKLAPHTEL